jgi:ribosomal protein S18 acetylase RimI-like enzyme
MTFHIRRYESADHDQVVALHRVGLESVGAYVHDGPSDDDLQQIEKTYLNARGEFLVGVLDEQVAAMGALRHVDKHTAELKRMRVSPSLQRRGLGRQMLHALEARAFELGYSVIVLDTTARQAAAIALYKGHGYLETARAEQGPLPIVFFRKTLDPETTHRAHADTAADGTWTAISG